MKQKGIPKEKLTMVNIRSDLRKKLWKSWVGLACCVLLLAWIVYSITLAPEVLFAGNFWLALFLVVILLVCSVLSVWRACGGFRHHLWIVTDKLISVDGSEEMSMQTYTKHFHCTLRFARYGNYHVPQKNHRWSQLYPLSCQGEYYHAAIGDEYYLVLSKPHSGKILLAYNAKLFELESDQV